MTEGVNVEMYNPDDVRTILEGLEANEDEVLADETTRQVRAALAAPIAALVAAVGAA